ncbi:hypothetical protein GMOD_00004321 [Pyrenophora seminiperda CCB06]|uniref:Uncharacterized protein n=1 Tax=Pyrenophora seminiperda CCB06 TaxID=1302712 RepID=A0A3M7M0Y6_9PLEO|nr:hypothetical protein GMOD_00004321 [Pyrenophora seminiperda CCB06]
MIERSSVHVRSSLQRRTRPRTCSHLFCVPGADACFGTLQLHASRAVAPSLRPLSMQCWVNTRGFASKEHKSLRERTVPTVRRLSRHYTAARHPMPRALSDERPLVCRRCVVLQPLLQAGH